MTYTKSLLLLQIQTGISLAIGLFIFKVIFYEINEATK